MLHNGLTAFSLHAYDDGAAATFAALRAETAARPAVPDLAGLDAETAARRHLDQALASPAVAGLTTPVANGAATDFRAVATDRVPLTGTRTVRFRQVAAGVPVHGSLVTVELEPDNSLVALDTALGSPDGVDPVATVSAADAARATVDADDGYKPAPTGVPPALTFWFDPPARRWRLVYVFEDVPVTTGGAPVPVDAVDYVVDAHDGQVVAALPRTFTMTAEDQTAADEYGARRSFRADRRGDHLDLRDPVRNVETHDFGFHDPEREADLLPGALLTDPPAWTPSAVSAHANAVVVCDYLHNVLERDNIDDHGGALVSSINCVLTAQSQPGSREWGNAFWSAAHHQMVYGQVRHGAALRSMSANQDVVAHEMFHGVTDSTARLDYHLQSGALNESYSDIFGAVVANRDNPDPRRWDWLIAENLLADDRPLRDMAQPTRFGQPDTMLDFRDMPDDDHHDFGGVHTNSGIHNKAAYNLFTAQGADGQLIVRPDDVVKIFYVTLTQRLAATSQLSDARRLAVATARTLFRTLPAADRETRVDAVDRAFRAVDIHPEATGDDMQPGEMLRRGHELASAGGTVRFAYQTDGNLVLRRDGAVHWSSGTDGAAAGGLIMQNDGNLVAYAPDHRVVWASHTNRHPGSRLLVQDDGNVVIRDVTDAAIWSTNTFVPAGPDATGNHMQPGSLVRPGRTLISTDGRFVLAYQTDGNLVLYRQGRVRWASGTDGHRAGVLSMQYDGNLVVYDADNVARWASGTDGHPGARLWVQQDGNLVVYGPHREVLWASGTNEPIGPTATGDDMRPDELLHPGDGITSANGHFRFLYQDDGNLVLYRDGAPLWAGGTSGTPAGLCVMQGDGNLVVYDADIHPVWASGTDGHPGAHLVVQDDGNLVVYAAGGGAVWATGTVVAAGDDMQPGELLEPDSALTSDNARFRLVYQGDGNLVVYRGNRALWATNTNGTPPGVCVMQHDGNLVVYTPEGLPVWASGTDGHPGSRLLMQGDGDLVLYATDGAVVWATGTDVVIARGDSMQPGEQLDADDRLVSADGRFELLYQGDGNLVLYRAGILLWASDTGGPAGECVMQDDGNLVIYTPDGTPVWATDTWGNPGCHLVVQADGNVVVYTPAGAALWATGTSTAAGDDMEPGEQLGPDDAVVSPNGRHRFLYQGDGNLVLYQDGVAHWASDTDGTAPGVCRMQPDGNLVVYAPGGVPVWASGTNDHPGSRLVVQDDGNVVLYGPDGRPVWATGTNQVVVS